MEECRMQPVSNDYLDLIFQNYELFEIYLRNVCKIRITNDLYIAYIDRNLAPELTINNYAYDSIPNVYGLMDEGSLNAAGILRVRDNPFLELYGAGILIGFLDTGIDIYNNLFRTSTGQTRIETIWDQTDILGKAPSGFLYGSEYSKEEINEIILQDNQNNNAGTDNNKYIPGKDENGHGTYVAGLAAGGIDEKNNFSGAAPYASIAVVKLKEAKQHLREFYFIDEDAVCYAESDILCAINYLTKVAERLDMPLVICIALGTNLGNHSGDSPLCRYLKQLSGQMKGAIVCAAGNEALNRHHFGANITGEQKYEEMEIEVERGNTGFTLEIWGQRPNTFSVSITSPSGETIPRIPSRLGQSDILTFIFDNTIIYIDYRLVETNLGEQLIILRVKSPTEGIWRLRVYEEELEYGIFNAWLPIKEFLNKDVHFVRSNPETTATEPSYADGVISVGAYNYRTNSIYNNSGWGYAVDGRVKPDIAASGVDVKGPGKDARSGYVVKSGTSPSVAITAGGCALILEWANRVVGGGYSMTSQRIENYLIRGADRNPDIKYPNQIWGYGSLNVYGTIDSFRIM